MEHCRSALLCLMVSGASAGEGGQMAADAGTTRLWPCVGATGPLDVVSPGAQMPRATPLLRIQGLGQDGCSCCFSPGTMSPWPA